MAKPKTVIIFLLTSVLAILISHWLLLPHLKYGFADVDWIWLTTFKREPNPFTPAGFFRLWQVAGVYSSQAYYMGIQEILFGLKDYLPYHQTTHLFKILSVITVFPLVLTLTKRKLAAVLSTLLYSVAFPAVAAMYTVATSVGYLGVTLMNLFLSLYFTLVQKGQTTWKWNLFLAFLFYLTLYSAPERMYPLIPFVVCLELFYLWKNKQNVNVKKPSFIRLILLVSPVLVGFVLKPMVVTPFFDNTGIITNKIQAGNWQLILNPFASLGSLFLPGDTGRIFGKPNISDLSHYINFISGGPLVIFGLITLLTSQFLAKYKLKFIFQTIIFTGLYSFIAYLLANHQLHLNPVVKVHFDPAFVMINALMGGFIFALATSALIQWTNDKANRLLLIFSTSIFAAFIFIFMTWIPSDYVLVFMGIHRYLTVPSLWATIFIVSFLIIVFDKIRGYKLLKPFAWLVFLLFIPIVISSTQLISAYFKSEITFTGTDGAAHKYLKDKLWSFMPNYSLTKPSLVYFSDAEDYPNGYFHETTVIAGFNYWLPLRDPRVFASGLSPQIIRSGLVCSTKPESCLENLKQYVTTQNNVKGLLYNNVFYHPDNFYAFRLYHRDITDISQTAKKIIGI